MATAKTPSKKGWLLDPEKIINAIDRYSHGTIPFTADDLKTPNPEKMRSVYIMLVSLIYEVPTDELILPRFEDFQGINYPDILEESISLMTTTLQIQHCFVKYFNIRDFTVKDIIAPGAKRTHRFLSYLVNFVCYFEDLMEVRVAAAEKAAEMHQEIDLCIETEERCRTRIAELRQQQAHEQNAIEEMTPELNELAARYDELQMQERYDRKGFEESQEEIDRLELLLEVDQNLKTIKKLQSDIKESLELLKNLSEKERVTLEFVENSQIAMSLIKDISQCLDRVRNVQAELKILRDKNLSKEHENKNAAAQIQNQERQLSSKMDRLSRVTVQDNKKVSCLTEQIEELKRQRVGLEKVRQEELKTLQAIDNRRAAEEEILATKTNEHNKKMETMRDAYQRILNQVNTYHTALADSWMEIAPFYGLEIIQE